jgi:hypothetical protein
MSETPDQRKKKVKTDEYRNVIREEVRHELGDTKSEAERSLEGIRDKMKAGAKAMGAKMEDPDRDLDAQYEKKKAEEKLKEQ